MEIKSYVSDHYTTDPCRGTSIVEHKIWKFHADKMTTALSVSYLSACCCESKVYIFTSLTILFRADRLTFGVWSRREQSCRILFHLSKHSLVTLSHILFFRMFSMYQLWKKDENGYIWHVGTATVRHLLHFGPVKNGCGIGLRGSKLNVVKVSKKRHWIWQPLAG